MPAKGLPAEHVPINRFLCIPVINSNRIVALGAVANKPSNYDELDIQGITSLLQEMWHIVQLKSKEEQLRKLSAAVEQSPASVVITDPTGNIEYVNPKFTDLTGYTLEESVGQNPRILKSGEQSIDVYRQLWKTISAGKVWRGELHNKKKGGELYWEDVSISPILDEKGILTHYLAVKEDITENKKLVDELITAKEKAEESNRLKSSFLANMSHEIRTPMNGILGFIELIREPDLTEENREKYIEIINSSGERLLNTINDIIVVSKIEAGAEVISCTEEKISAMLDDHLTFFNPQFEKKGIACTLVNHFDHEEKIRTDRSKFNTIITNLLGNALKFTKTGEVELGCIKHSHEHIHFYVRDTGRGIPANRTDAIFELFVQADISITRAHEGSGLGLSIVRSYVEMLGGKIWVDSEVDKGSTFHFTLPALSC
jgi:hypothetical protein